MCAFGGGTKYLKLHKDWAVEGASDGVPKRQNGVVDAVTHVSHAQHREGVAATTTQNVDCADDEVPVTQ